MIFWISSSPIFKLIKNSFDKEYLTKAFAVMKKDRVHLAIVKNSKGKFIGIITLEDMIEEIVGDIYDVYYFEKGMGEPISQL